MPPNRWSRDRFTTGITDDDGVLYLSEREPYAYRELADNVVHRVTQGDTLWTLAATYYEGIERPARFWWAIGDFQPDPIHDPTIALAPDSELVIPSIRTLQEEILNERRRMEHEP